MRSRLVDRYSLILLYIGYIHADSRPELTIMYTVYEIISRTGGRPSLSYRYGLHTARDTWLLHTLGYTV